MINFPSTLSDHPSLIGIVRFPKCTFTTVEVNIPIIIKNTITYENWLQKVLMADTITGISKTSVAIDVPKAQITDFYPYTYYVLTDGEVDSLLLKPQYMASPTYIASKVALSNQPVERFYAVGYKGDTEGRIYNITNNNQMMLPTATNEGISYINANANAIAQNRKSQNTDLVLNGITTVGNAVATQGTSLALGGVQGFTSSLSAIKETNARNKDLQLSPHTISSFGTPSTRDKFGTNNVRVVKYTITDQAKAKINNFVNRYGNKYNNYATINLRVYKGYIKFIAPDLDTTIDNIYTSKIKEILERGVYVE